jgi:hypothetical protein
MKFLIIAALLGSTEAIKSIKGTGMSEDSTPVARSSEDL